jgi:hypothetical protein
MSDRLPLLLAFALLFVPAVQASDVSAPAAPAATAGSDDRAQQLVLDEGAKLLMVSACANPVKRATSDRHLEDIKRTACDGGGGRASSHPQRLST